DGLGLFDFAVGPGQNLLRGRDRNPDLVEDLGRRRRIEKIHNLLVHGLLLACRSKPAANSKILLSQAPRPSRGRSAEARLWNRAAIPVTWRAATSRPVRPLYV